MLATDGTSSFVLYLYAEIQWITADLKSTFSGSGSGSGSESGGSFFVTPQPPNIALAGFLEETGNATLLPGSGTEDIMGLASTSNVGKPGLWIFKVDENITFGGTYVYTTHMNS